MIPSSKSSRTRRPSSAAGQVMVLGCVTLLVLALTLMLSFSLSNAVHEKIRVQTHADAAAFSTATLEARAMNVVAYGNRAVAAIAVTSLSVHAWMAIASEHVEILDAASRAFRQVALFEGALGWKHAAHVAEALRIARAYRTERDTVAARVASHEQSFNDAVAALTDALREAQAHELDVVERTYDELSRGGSGAVLSELRDRNAPYSDYAEALLGANAGEFACALEGTSFDEACAPFVRRTDAPAGDEVRSAVIRHAANAARGAFAFDCGGGDCTAALAPTFHARLLELRNGLGSVWFSFSAQAFLTESGDPAGPLTDGALAQRAETEGDTFTAQWRCVIGAAPIRDVHVVSDDDGGSHRPASAHDEEHAEFSGLCAGGSTPCFVNFRASDRLDDDFGQPSAYAGVRQRLWLTRLGDRGPWDLNDRGRVDLDLGEGLQPSLTMRPRYGASDEGFAVAKAKVYFHQPKRWRTAPNLFDPFWRAKLHPFGRDELVKALGPDGAQDEQGESIASASGTPVEGEILP